MWSLAHLNLCLSAGGSEPGEVSASRRGGADRWHRVSGSTARSRTLPSLFGNGVGDDIICTGDGDYAGCGEFEVLPLLAALGGHDTTFGSDGNDVLLVRHLTRPVLSPPLVTTTWAVGREPMKSTANTRPRGAGRRRRG